MLARYVVAALVLAGCSEQAATVETGQTYALTDGAELTMNGPPETSLPGAIFMPDSQLRKDGIASPDEHGVTSPSESLEATISFVELCVDDKGAPTDVRLLRSSGVAKLDEAAVDLVRTSQLRPARSGGKPVAYCGHVFPIRWNIPAQR